MVEGGGDALVWAVALIALILLPLVSWLIAEVGSEISAALEDKPPAEAEIEAEVARRLRDAGA